MNRLTPGQIKYLMNEWEYRHGESCIEYVGYGYAFNFAEYLMTRGYTFNEDYYDTFESLKDHITAYLDVVNAFDNYCYEEVLTYLEFPEYMSKFSTDEEYNNFISSLKEEN